MAPLNSRADILTATARAGDDGPPAIDMTVHTPRLDETDTEDEEYLMVLTPERAVALGQLLSAAGLAAMLQPAGDHGRS